MYAFVAGAVAFFSPIISCCSLDLIVHCHKTLAAVGGDGGFVWIAVCCENCCIVRTVQLVFSYCLQFG